MSGSIAGSVLLVGCGKMGGAMAAGWLDRGLQDLLVVEPNQAGMRHLAGRPGLRQVPDPKDIPAAFRADAVVLAVKPQYMDGVLPAYRRFGGAGTLILSIAAGKTLGYFAEQLGGDAAVVRSMPNLPASIGRGITVAVASPQVGPTQRQLAHHLLAACGEVDWVDQEALLDAVTAVSGGGPAYVFLLAETLAKAGEAAGLPADLAARLARVTVAGAGELLARSADSPSTLRENVTSPAGTTLEALKILMAADGVQPLYDRAIAAATRRSRELSGPG